MSEFSESYHLRSERAEDAVELLKSAGRKGFVYQPVNGWVTFVAEEGIFEPDKKIVAAAKQPLLHYVSAEDHGWSFALFDNNKEVTGFCCDWDSDITFDDTRYSRAALQSRISSIQPALLDEFERLMRPKDFDDILKAERSKLLAQALGLEHYDWLAYDYIADSFHVSPQDFPGMIEVSRDAQT